MLKCEITNEPISKQAENRLLTYEGKYELLLKYQALGYHKSKICREINMDIRSYNRLIAMSDDERETLFSNRKSEAVKIGSKLKSEHVEEVRNLESAGFSLREISRRTGLAFVTVKKYIDKDFDPTITYQKEHRISILSPYYNTIETLMHQGVKGPEIIRCISEKGYSVVLLRKTGSAAGPLSGT